MTDDAPTLKTGPLEGLVVIELGSTVAGPYCARMLADFGAVVIKVEQREGDAVRSMGKRKHGKSLYAASILRNKSNVSIDLRTEQGRGLVREMAAKADVVIENFKPGTLEKWGLGYDVLSADNPGLVLVRISGYGQTGPYRERPGYGVVCEAVSGMREVTGDPDRPPARVAVSLTDYITGLHGAFGAAAALLARVQTGKGQVVDTALYEAAFSFMEPHIPAFQQLGYVAERAGSRLPDNTPNALYPTADGRHIHITAISNSIFARLAEAMQKPELATDPLFATGVERSRNEDALDKIISDWTTGHLLTEIEAKLQLAKVPASRIYNMRDIFDDPHYAAREAIVNVRDDTLGEVSMANVVPRLSDTPGRVSWPGRRIGEDTRAVLRQFLGLEDRIIDSLQASGVVFDGAETREGAA